VSVDIHALIARNAQRWASMHLKADRISKFDKIAQVLCLTENKMRFQAVTKRLVKDGHQPVPWWFIAVVAYREYGGPPRWDRQLGQGDPLHSVSRNEPAGRGPFYDHPGDTIDDNAWLRGALDALIDCSPHAAKWLDWSIGGVLTLWEEYNGLGYAMRGVPSAYVWSGTDQYVSGKYVRDRDYRPGVVDAQEGCAALLARMMVIDKQITFGVPAPAGSLDTHPIVQAKVVPKQVEPVAPTQVSWLGMLGLLFNRLFRKD
jgi:lysozyme family protein